MTMTDTRQPKHETEHAMDAAESKKQDDEFARTSAALMRSEFDRADLERQLKAEKNRAELLRRDVLALNNRLDSIKQDDAGELLWVYPDGQKCIKPRVKHRADWIRTYACYALPGAVSASRPNTSDKDIADYVTGLAHAVWSTVQTSLGEPDYAPDRDE